MDIRKVGVLGLGLLGRGIAACLLAHGFHVVGYTRRAATHAEARGHIAQALDELVRRGGFDPALREAWPGRFTAAQDFAPLAGCDFVIESVLEDLAAKQAVFDQVEAVVGPDVPIASNTSALPITQLQRQRRHPERFVGMHWAEPCHITRFLELIRGEQTADAAFEAAAALGRRMGKEPSFVQKDVPGFVVNRLAYAFYREALHLLETGVADVETIDRSFRNACGLWATIAGPFRWIDLTGGPALYARAMRGVLPTLSNASELPKTMRDLAEEGAAGITNGRGFYAYTEEEAKHWERLFVEHAWKVRELMNGYFPPEKGGA